VQDPWENNVPGLGLGRDPVRTPIPWDESPGAGFTAGRPWLPIGPGNRALNVAAQEQDASSMLALYRSLIALRRFEPALVMGDYVPVAATHDILAFERRQGGRRVLVALNLGQSPQRLNWTRGAKELLLSTNLERSRVLADEEISLQASEGAVIRAL
jgi:alpha-glucosidase